MGLRLDINTVDCCCDGFSLTRIITEGDCKGVDPPIVIEGRTINDCGCPDGLTLPSCFLIDIEGVTEGDLCPTDGCEFWNGQHILRQECSEGATTGTSDDNCACAWVSKRHTLPRHEWDCYFWSTVCTPARIFSASQLHWRLSYIGGNANTWSLQAIGLLGIHDGSGVANPIVLASWQLTGDKREDPHFICSLETGTGTGSTNTFPLSGSTIFCPETSAQELCTDWPATIFLEQLDECPPQQLEGDELDDCNIDEVRPCGDCPIPCSWVVSLIDVANDSCSDCDLAFNKPYFLRRDHLLCRWSSTQCDGLCDTTRAHITFEDPNPGTGTGSNSTTVLVTFWIANSSGITATYSDELEMPLSCSRGIVITLDSNDGKCQTWPPQVILQAGYIPAADDDCWPYECVDADECASCGCNNPDSFEVTITGLDPGSTVCDEYNYTHVFLPTADPCVYETIENGVLTFKVDSILMTFDVGSGTVVNYSLADCTRFSRNCFSDFIMAYDSGGSFCSGWPSTLTVTQP
jgi:hypothetical protein